MVAFENRVKRIISSLQKISQLHFDDKEISFPLERDYFECAPMVQRKLEACNDVERNPGPKANGIKDVSRISGPKNNDVNDIPRVSQIEDNIQGMEQTMANLDTSMSQMLESLESMKPAYAYALQMLEKSSGASSGIEQKNNLVFYGIEPEPLERQMEAEPEFCRDILETRIKGVFRDVLKISRDIPFTHVYRFTVGNADKEEIRPIVAGFKSVRDKENILRHTTSSKILKQRGIYVTEDFSSKNSRQVQQEKIWKDGPLAAAPGVPGSPNKKSIAPQSPRKIKTNIEYESNNFSTKSPPSPTKQRKATPASPKKTPVSPIKTLNKNLKNKPNALNRQPIDEHLLPHSNKRNQTRRESRKDLESSAGMSDRRSSCSHSDYAASSNSGNSSSGAFTDAEL